MASVLRVLIVSFLSFLKSRFFCWSRSLFLFLIIITSLTAVLELATEEPSPVSNVSEVSLAILRTLAFNGLPLPAAFCTETKSPSFKSSVNVVLNPVTVLELLAIETVPPSVKDVSNTKSAVNLLPAVD